MGLRRLSRINQKRRGVQTRRITQYEGPEDARDKYRFADHLIRFVAVGDADQLESVGAGSVFRELIQCGLVPVTVLDQIFRQAEDSLIAYNAKFIRESSGQLHYGRDFSLTETESQEETAALIRRNTPAGEAELKNAS